jgi:hypothetical protein
MSGGCHILLSGGAGAVLLAGRTVLLSEIREVRQLERARRGRYTRLLHTELRKARPEAARCNRKH